MSYSAVLPLHSGIPNEPYDWRQEHSSRCRGSASGCARCRGHLDYWAWNVLQTARDQPRGKLGLKVINWNVAVQLEVLAPYRLPLRNRFCLVASAGFAV
jgi:hypothetical protein